MAEFLQKSLEMRRTAFLLAFDDHLDIKRKSAFHLKIGSDGAGMHYDAGLVVGGAPPVEPPIALGGRKRRGFPKFLASRRLDIVMSVKQQGRGSRGVQPIAVNIGMHVGQTKHFHVLKASRLHEGCDGRSRVFHLLGVKAGKADAGNAHQLLEVGYKIFVIGMSVRKSFFLVHGLIITKDIEYNGMPILPRYFLKIFLPIFLVCLAMFLGVLLMNHFIKIFNMAVMRGISPLWIATCFARLLPFISSLALPMAFLVALLLTLGQLAEGGEIMALRASGFSFMEMTWPFLAVGVMLSGLLFYMNHKASPEGFHSFRNKYAQAAQQLARLDLEPRTFMKLGPWRLYSEKVDKKTGNMEGVYFLRQGRTQEDKGVRINALRGRMNIAKGKAVTLEQIG